MIDLLVAGAGPVGLATAVMARRAGLDVAVVEPRRDPVDKACGEGLMPTAVQALADLGVVPDGRAFRGIRYVDGAVEAQAAFHGGHGLGVRRTTLHAALAEAARAAGVTRLHGRVDDVHQDGDGVEACGVRARWLAAADGLHSRLRETCGLARPAPGPARYGLRRHYRVPVWTDMVEVHWADHAEAYVTPVADDLVGVAVLCGGGSSYDEWLAGFPHLRERLAGASPVGRVIGAGPLRQRAGAVRSGRVLLVGDAAGYVDALTGEGVAVGLACARALVRCLVEGRPEDYDAAWRRASRRYRASSAALLWTSRRPALRARLVPWAARAPRVFAAAVNAVG